MPLSGEGNLVGSLVQRLVTRLPHRTGSSVQDIDKDELVSQTRATLIDISATRLSPVVQSLLRVLEELIAQYKDADVDPPPHVLSSEIYIVEIISQCFCAHWDHLNRSTGDTSTGNGHDNAAGNTPHEFDAYKRVPRTPHTGVGQGLNEPRRRDVNPGPLSDILVGRILEALKTFLAPFADQYSLPASTILGESERITPHGLSTSQGERQLSAVSSSASEAQVLFSCAYNDIEDHCRIIVEFLSASNWVMIFEHLKRSLRILQVVFPLQGNGVQTTAVLDDDVDATATLRFVAFFWVDTHKLSLVLSEICACFFHLRKTFQNTLALVLPTLIMRWIEQNPEDFVHMHLSHNKFDGGADRLFDIANSMVDNGRWRAVLYPFQMSLLFLLPDVFEVATSMPSTGRYVEGGGLPKAGSHIYKKVVFLESLRKALRNRNSAAAYSLVLLLRTARHFNMDTTDSALLSYALDVHDDVREALFRKPLSAKEPAVFDDGLLTAAFVTQAFLNFKTCHELIAPLSVGPTAPRDYTVAFISACSYLARQHDHRRYSLLFDRVALVVRVHLKALWLQGDDSQLSESYGQPLSASLSRTMTLRSLEFLGALPFVMFDEPPAELIEYEEFVQENFCILVNCLLSRDEDIMFMAMGVCKSLLADGSIFSIPDEVDTEAIDSAESLWRWTSEVLLNVLESVEGTGSPNASVLGFIDDFLRSRLEVIKSSKTPIVAAAKMPEHLAVLLKLESFFLSCLCSADIETCQLVTSCIRKLCEESVVIEAADESSKPSVLLKNLEVYQALSSKDFRFTGLVAFQKRFRSILRGMTQPSAGILNAWEGIFERWYLLSKRAFSARKPENFDERVFAEWRNCSGFLASSAASCVFRELPMSDESAALKWIDRSSQGDSSDHHSILGRYMATSIQLLSCSHVRVREATREILSSEVSPALYLSLFTSLESELEILFDGPVETSASFSESRMVFAEQAASLLRTIIERLDSPADVGMSLSIDIGALTLNFARFISSMAEGSSVLRIKIKLCHLCEVITRKKELLNLRHDVRIRNHLLEIVFSWVARPTSSSAISSQGPSRDDIVKLQKDLDRACLKALSDLTFRLPLQPAEGQSDADTSDLRSEMFHTYFNRFLSLLQSENLEHSKADSLSITSSKDSIAPVRDLAIMALSNLLSANIDVGLKHSLSIGYHEDLEIRTAFVTVLCNVLAQGTDFSNLSDDAIREKYDELVDVLVHDMTLTVALCDACPSTEVDELTMSLLNIFDSRGLAFVLLEELIKHEVAETENQSELLRRNCVTTKMLSVYARWKGSAYLRSTLQNVLERLVATAQDLDLELDPSKTASSEELQRNALQLRIVTKVFIDDICNSAAKVPVSFRKICSIISTAVEPRFPDAKYMAVGAFIFLRFFCPAIVAPDVEGLTSTMPSKELRRGLLLIAKIIQNCANNVLFGAKESYMFPLNDFLARNGPKVHTFLIEISVAPKIEATVAEKELYDFGSCVALHRFFYDHWDHVRQKLVAQQRQAPPTLSQDGQQSSAPVLEALRKLISNLGPPPMDISWNRPLVALNSPPLYSRFQHFMLRNAGRSAESELSTKAVYDGGETKDGLSIICIILRNIDAEAATDFDLLIYCYLKIASRMWHKPFGILIDSTCYTGQNEPQDGLFKKLDHLTPSELSKNLSRIYVYNMNSAFRKCFRRMIRLSQKNENSVFNPANVDYHLIGNFPDLQSHFQMNQLHLPAETLSVATDTRFVFQPIVRLSKTKGKIEVAIQVGTQFAQITTTKKQEVVPGLHLSATVNDVFRVTEVDEAPTSIQTENDSAFGLKTESGKIVMYFTSPRKSEILQAIRGAKAKYSKDTKPLPSFERSIRPQDVPGTLLNISLLNLASSDEDLRIAAYNLLCALCKTFRFDGSSKFLPSKDIAIPPSAATFIVSVSKQLAILEPQLTADFINEFFVGWDSFPLPQRHMSLAYLSPWLPALRTQVLAAEPDGEKARDKVASIFRKLIDVAVSDSALALTLEHTVWAVICEDDVQTDIFLDELVKTALAEGPSQNEAISSVCAVISSLETVVVRGKVIARLRKAINRTSLRPTRTLPGNSAWNEICVLLKLSLSLSFNSEAQGHLFFAETAHIITMLANTGPADIRLVVHRLLVNTIHSLCTSFSLEDSKLARLRIVLASLSESNSDKQVSLNGVSREGVLVSQAPDHSMQILHSTESLATLLLEVMGLGAPSVDLANSWRSRWMGLVASTAFQSNPAIQPRAFTVMGCLAREDVDDDLLYQVLVALRSSVKQFAVDDDNEMLAAIITSLTKMMENLPTTSRYGLQLFWLAIALVRLMPLSLFACAASFLQAVLLNINTSGDLKDGRMVQVLLQGKLPLEDPALLLDESYGIQFNVDNFHFAVCATLVKGLTDASSKVTTLRVLSTFLEITSSNGVGGSTFPEDLSCLPYLVLVVTRAATSEEAKGNMRLAGIAADATKTSSENMLRSIDLDMLKDKELLLNAAIGLVDFKYLEDVIQNRGLVWLNEVATDRPTVILHLFEPIFGVLDDVLHSSQNSQTLQSAQTLLRTLTTNPKLADTVDTRHLLEVVLDDLGFSGLWRSSTFHTTTERDNKHCSILTERLIALITS